jgi:acyl-CoA thioesterase FadM
MTTAEPYLHEIRVAWGDCDPARIAYTGRIPGWALEAINGFWEEVLGGGWYQMELDMGFGTPFVNMNLDFRAPITPRHRLICAVVPEALGHTSVSFRVEGRQNGTLCFEGRFTAVFVRAGTLEKCPAPEAVRRALAPYW